MAAITPTTGTAQLKAGYHYYRTYGTGTANQADTLTSPAPGEVRRLVSVTIAYSNTPTQAGVVISLDSGLGSGYDTTLTTGSANARYTVYIPTTDLYLMPDDAILVSAPAGGSGLTAAITIVTEGK